MQHNTAFHQGLHCLFDGKKGIQSTIFFENYNPTPLDTHNGLSQVYCIKPKGRIH